MGRGGQCGGRGGIGPGSVQCFSSTMIRPSARTDGVGRSSPIKTSKAGKVSSLFMNHWTAVVEKCSHFLGLRLKSSRGESRLAGMKPTWCLVRALAAICLLMALAAASPVFAGEPPTPVQHVGAKAAAALVATNGVVVLDVRTAKEFSGGHIGGATNIDTLAGDFGDRVAKLDRSKTYLVHCASGKRSINSLPQLQRLGFTNLIHLDGGLAAWQAAGNAVTKK